MMVYTSQIAQHLLDVDSFKTCVAGTQNPAIFDRSSFVKKKSAVIFHGKISLSST